MHFFISAFFRGAKASASELRGAADTPDRERRLFQSCFVLIRLRTRKIKNVPLGLF